MSKKILTETFDRLAQRQGSEYLSRIDIPHDKYRDDENIDKLAMEDDSHEASRSD